MIITLFQAQTTKNAVEEKVIKNGVIIRNEVN